TIARSAHAAWVWHFLSLSPLLLHNNQFQHHPFGCFVREDSAGPNALGCSSRWPWCCNGLTVCFSWLRSFDGRQPVLAGLDPILIKNILVKECYTNFGLNGILGSAISMAEDEKWKRIRTVLSPALTSGKLKEVNIFEAYSMDVVVSTSFSVNIDSMSNPSDPFVTNMKKFLRFMLFPFIAPVLEKMNVTLLPSRVMDFFKVPKIVVFSFLHVLLCIFSALSDEEILAQARVFVFAGYETTSSTLSYLSYNLATHPDVQQQLRDEIDAYLPNRVKEGEEMLGLYQKAGWKQDRMEEMLPLRFHLLCTLVVTIPKHMVVMIPAYVLHRDLAYWLEQEEFRPERTESIDPYTFLPFGAGPRNCIGMRFALLIVKVAVVVLLQHFSFRTFKDTPVRIWDGVLSSLLIDGTLSSDPHYLSFLKQSLLGCGDVNVAC
uniref:Uncharacterized protein n=1 Tax=Melopsittacus undulatus TaxID=13146 RepID=A0A8V5H7F1_MELUD